MVAILIANLLATLLSRKWAVPLIACTLAAIVLSNLVSVSSLNSWPVVAADLAGATVFLCPLFFAGALFSTVFKQTRSASQALAFNMFGGLLGVVLEYCSMVWGIRSLAFIAAGIYCCVLALELLANRTSYGAGLKAT